MVALDLGVEAGFTEASLQMFGTQLPGCYRPKQLATAFSGTSEHHGIFGETLETTAFDVLS